MTFSCVIKNKHTQSRQINHRGLYDWSVKFYPTSGIAIQMQSVKGWSVTSQSVRYLKSSDGQRPSIRCNRVQRVQRELHPISLILCPARRIIDKAVVQQTLHYHYAREMQLECHQINKLKNRSKQMQDHEDVRLYVLHTEGGRMF